MLDQRDQMYANSSRISTVICPWMINSGSVFVEDREEYITQRKETSPTSDLMSYAMNFTMLGNGFLPKSMRGENREKLS